MRFLIRLHNCGRYAPADRKQLTRSMYELVRPFQADIGNLRVSSFAVELDLLTSANENAERAVKVLEEKFGKLLTMRELDVQTARMSDAEAIELGLKLFNEERYWESHEALESAWRRAAGPEKNMLQALILIAAALVHLQKNELEVALSVMRRAQEKLQPYQGSRFGVDLDALKDRLNGLLSSGRLEFFRIEASL